MKQESTPSPRKRTKKTTSSLGNKRKTLQISEYEPKEETEWHRITCFAKLAEVAGEFLKKGRPVYVEGRLKTRKWADKDGKDNYSTEIVAENMQLLGDREGRGGGGGDEGGNGGYSARGGGRGAPSGGDRGEPSEGRSERPAARAPAPRAPAPKSSTGFDDMDDDIPF